MRKNENHHACIHSHTLIKLRRKHGSIMNRFAMASAPVPWTRRVQDPKPAAGSRPETRPITPSVTPSIPPVGCRGKGLLAIPKADCGSVLASIGITLPSKATGKGKAVFSPPIRPPSPRGPVHSSAAASSASVGVALTTGPVKRRSEARPRISSVIKSKSKRSDAPLVYNFTRGSKKRALEVASDSQAINDALAEYVRDWKSAGDTSEDYWRTWLELHEAHWDGHRRPRQDAIPLDPLKIHIIGTLLKIGSDDIGVQRTT